MFALKYLTAGELLTATEPWITDGDPARTAIEHGAALAGLFIPLTVARAGVREALGSLGVDEPTDDGKSLDGRHDELVHAIVYALSAAERMATDEARRAAVVTARKALFPHGTSVVNASFGDEAGLATARAAAITPAIRATLASITLEGATLETRVGELQTVGAALGGVVDTRAATAAAAAGEPRPKGKVLRAKNHLIQVIRTIESTLDATGADAATRDAIFGPLRLQAERAEARALARAAGGAPAPTPPSPPAAS